MRMSDQCSSRHADIIVRLDMNEVVGSGHAMRCMAIADEAERLGASVLFAVSEERSLSALRAVGRDAVIIGGECEALGLKDGEALGVLCSSVGAHSALIDAYGVTDSFFEGLHREMPIGCKVSWIDDMFTYECGELSMPIKQDVDRVVNYTLGADRAAYERLYAGVRTELCVDPRFAPVRPQFMRSVHPVSCDVARIMVTTGSTNEGYMLEKMVRACRQGVPDARVDVVVGSMASFESIEDDHVFVHRGLTDLSSLMHACDMCVCAAGTTLYELSVAGVAAVAVPMVENQIPNAKGFGALGLGVVVYADVDAAVLADEVASFAHDVEKRTTCIRSMNAMVDGRGAQRIAELLMDDGLRLREATMDDADIILEWVNDPADRANSFDSSPIARDEHLAWMRDSLADPDRLLFILENAGVPVGHIKLYREGDHAEVGYCVAPEHRGHGYAAAMLGLLRDGIDPVATGIKTITASVKPDNVASIRALERAGYMECSRAFELEL